MSIAGKDFSDTQSNRLVLEHEDTTLYPLVDLHVYIVPPDIWRDRFNNLLNQSVSETVSIGIIRVSPDIKLTDIRDELPRQLEDLVPSDFIFLRSVGRSLTRLKPKQEFQLKAKHFLPPVAYAPELYLLEATADIRASLTSDGSSRSQSYNRLAGDESQRGFHSYRDGPGGPYDDRYTQTKINEQPNEEHGLSPDERERDNYLEDYESKANASNRRKAGDNDDNKKLNQGKGRNSDNDKRRRADEDRKKYGGKSQAADDKSERNRSRYGDNDDRLTNGNDTDHSRWDDEDADSRKYRDSENEDNDSKRYRDNDNDRDSRRRSGSAGDDGFPTPPPLEMKSPREERDTDSAYGRRRDEKERLLAELDEARESRKSAEQDREELVKRAKQLQHKTTNRRNNARPLHEDREARDVWKKRYFEEKKRTAPLEDSTNRLRHELEVLHRKLMTTLEGPKDGKPVKYVDGKPSPKNNYIIQCTRLQHEIEDLRRRSENAKMKLTAEMKLRNQADAELRALRAELTQKKINLTLSRNRQLVALSPGAEMMEGSEEIAAQN